MEVHAVVLHGRHAHVSARGQAPGALLSGLVALNIDACRDLAQAGHVGVLSLAELLDEPDGLADFGGRGLHLSRHLGQGLATLLLLALGQGVDFGLGGGLLLVDGGEHGLVHGGEVLDAVDAQKLLGGVPREQRGQLGRAVLVRLDEV